MLTYQTMVYKGERYDERYGWDFGKIVLFKSNPHPDPASAMEEFNTLNLPQETWFAYMRVMQDDEIIDEEMFDSSTNTSLL